MIPADLAALPKAETHVHLEGTTRPATREEWASRTIIGTPASFTDLDTFVEMYAHVWRTMTVPGDYARLVREYCEDVVPLGVRYAELQLATAGRSYACLHEAAEEAERQKDITIRFIIDVPRSLPVEVGWAMLEAAKDVPQVVAIGLGGPEKAFPPEPFAALFEEAMARGLRSNPHAGEDAGAESIRAALDSLKAERIQHGVRAVDDDALVRELAERRIPLAMCLTSNLRLGVFGSLEEHSLPELWRSGVLVSVSTDDPGFFGCDIVDEYEAAGGLLDLDRVGYGRLARNSVEGSFAPEALKTGLRAEIEDWAKRGV